MSSAWAIVVFALATFVLCYPISWSPASLSRLDNGDARLNAWAMSWVAHQAMQNPFELFQANIFHPQPNSLAYSEHLLVEGLVAAPLLKLTDDLVLTQNLIFLAATFGSALAMYLLAFSLTRSHPAAILAGLFFSFAPYRFNRLPHIQMQLYGFIPLALYGLHRFFETERRRWLALFALSMVIQVLSGTYLAAMVAIACAVALVVLTPVRSLGRRDWLDLSLSLVLPALVILPVVAPYLWVNRTLGIEWDLEGVASLAATPKTYLAASSHLHRGWTESLTSPRDRIDYLFPGISLLVLGIFGVILALRAKFIRGSRRTGLLYLSLIIIGVILSLGPLTPIYRFLFEHVLFFRGLRALPRFSLLALLGLSVFSAFAIRWLLERTGRNRNLAALGIGLVYILETTALPNHAESFRDDPPEVYEFLATAKPGPIVELPFKVIDTRYMFWARHHGFRQMLNGDSGFIPESHNWMKQSLQRFPSPDSVALLRELEVRYVVLHLGAFRKRALLRVLNGVEEYRHALLPVRDFGRDALFEIIPARVARQEQTYPANAESHTQWISVSVQPSDAASSLLFDGSVTESWIADAHVAEVEMDLVERPTIAGIRIHYGPHPRVPIDQVDVLVEGQDGRFHSVFKTSPEWPALTQLVKGLLETPRDGHQLVSFETVEAERVRLVLRGLDQPAEITEIEVLAHRTR